jgi:hypothetical protein
VAALASGLEIRNPLRNRQEKNEFYFQSRRKNFLDSGIEARVSKRKERNSVFAKIFVRAEPPCIRSRRNELIWLLDSERHLRVDPISLCAQFPASRSERETLGKLQMQPTYSDIVRRFSLCIVRLNRPIIRRILFIGLLACFLCAPHGRAADELVPPFGFRWNDSMARVEAVLHGAKAKITSREKKENREVWTVEGLIHPGLKRTVFTFKERALVAVELQYEYPDWSIERYNQRMGEIRKYFDEKYGTGKLVSRSRDHDTDVIQTLVGYQWMVGATMLELFYFSAQHDNLLYRTISVDYKAL